MEKLIAVIKRELGIWSRRPIYMAGSVGVMACCCIFYLTFLSEGVPSDLPIGIVDNDNSSMSRNFIQQLDATQLGRVVMYDDFAEAREDMQRGDITSVCVIPQGMYADVQAQRQPTFTFYVNTLYFLGGSLSYKDILTMINLTSGAVARQVMRMKGMGDAEIMGRLRPVDVDVHMIGNATMNYGAYLANTLLPVMLEMIVIILTIYCLGTELKYGTSRELLALTGGDFYVAIGGKLLLLTGLYTLIAWTLMFLLYGIMHFPLACSIGWMLLDSFLMVVASEAVALVILSCIPVLRFALSVGALFSVLALSLTGFTLPLETMPGPIQAVAELLPMRHYYLMAVRCGMFDGGFALCYKEILHMMIYIFAPLTVLWRLRDAYIKLDYAKK